MKLDSRRTVYTRLTEYCYFAGESDYSEVTEWTNGDGIDVTVATTHAPGYRTISLTWGEFKAIKKMIKFLKNAPIDNIDPPDPII